MQHIFPVYLKKITQLHSILGIKLTEVLPVHYLLYYKNSEKVQKIEVHVIYVVYSVQCSFDLLIQKLQLKGFYKRLE